MHKGCNYAGLNHSLLFLEQGCGEGYCAQPTVGLSGYPQYAVDPPRGVGGTGELLQAAARKIEQDLARHRQLIEDLRRDGHRTTEAEDVLQRFETAYQALLAKLNALRGERTG